MSLSSLVPLGNKTSSSEYLHDRKLLPPFIGPFPLGGFMIGCTASSLFFGWQTGLSFGWGNMAAALVLSSIMYTTLLLSVSEMCTALPFTSGLSTFAQAAFNPEMFAFSGALHAISFIIFPAILLLVMGDTMCLVFLGVMCRFNKISNILCFLSIPALTIMLHLRPRLLFRMILILSIYCCVLVAAYITIGTFLQPPRMIDGTVLDKGTVSIYFSGISLLGIIRAFPFACYFFIGIESFPSTSEEAKKIFQTAPKVVKYCLSLLVVFSVGLLATFPDQFIQDSVNSVHPAAVNGASDAPSVVSSSASMYNPSRRFIQSRYLLLDYSLTLVCSRLTPRPEWCENMGQLSNNVYVQHGNHLISVLMALTVLPPIFLSFIAATYVSARHIYFLSRSGILPVSISRTRSGAPIFATCASLVLAIATIGLIYALNEIPHLMQPIFLLDNVASSNKTPTQSSVPIDRNIANPRFRTQTSLMLILAYFWVSCLTYVIKFGTYVALCLRVPNLPRPFVSPFGICGAYIGLLICLGFGVIGPLFLGPSFYGSLLAIGVVLTVIGTLYWVFVAKVRVANNPEKIFIRHQLKQLWGRSYAPQLTPYHARNRGRNIQLHSTNVCSSTVPLNSVGLPNPIYARFAAFCNCPSQWLSYSTHPCSTTVQVNSEGVADYGV